MKVGYMRVSTRDQHIENQRPDLLKYGVQKFFVDDGISGKSLKNRDGLVEMLDFIREGDEVVVVELNRLSRNMQDMQKILGEIKLKGAIVTALNLKFLAEINDPSIKMLMSNIMFELLGYMSEQERLNMLERQRRGIEQAKKEGKFVGRKPYYDANTTNKRAKMIYELVVDMLDKKTPILQISEKTGLSRTTIYKIKRGMTDNNHSVDRK